MNDEIRRGVVFGSGITANGVRRQIVLANPRHRQMTRASEAISAVIKEEVERKEGDGIFSLSRLIDALH
jgi:hypothetical protein